MRTTVASLALLPLLFQTLTLQNAAAEDFDEYDFYDDFEEDGEDRPPPAFWVKSQYGSIKARQQAAGLGLSENDRVHLMALVLGGQYQLVPTLSVHASLPVVHARFEDEAETTLGNLSVGLTHTLTAGVRSQSSLETSLSFSTADGGGMGASAAGSFASFWAPDPGLYQANSTTVRATYRHHLGDKERGIELGGGIHHLFFDMATDQTRVPVTFTGHVNVGGAANMLARFTNLWIMRGGSDSDDDFLHLLEGGLEIGNIGNGDLAMMLYYPLDDSYRNVLEVWGMSLGYRTAI